MSEVQSPLKITEVVLRDAQQSLLDARLRLDDMLPIAAKLDRVGFWSLETWGGATFETCIRHLGEDPWERLRALKEVMPNTPQQMLLRGQSLLGCRHYADDVVAAFVERARVNGIEVFRIFDALNDPRNLECVVKAVRSVEGHVQAALAYTVSPMHTLDEWERLAVRFEAMGADSLAIKDMAGLLTPDTTFELVTRLKKRLKIPLSLHGNATSGLSTATALKAVEAGIDVIDTTISSMTLGYGHRPTESLVAALAGTARDTGLDLGLLEEIAAYFREVRKKYSAFEGALRDIDGRTLTTPVLSAELQLRWDELRVKAEEEDIRLAEGEDELDDVLTYTLFPQAALALFKQRGEHNAVDPPPETVDEPEATVPLDDTHQRARPSVYTVTVEGERYMVEVVSGVDGRPQAVSARELAGSEPSTEQSSHDHPAGTIRAPLSGSVFKLSVEVGDTVAENDVVAILEIMKMETEVRATCAGTVSDIWVREGDSVSAGDTLLVL